MKDSRAAEKKRMLPGVAISSGCVEGRARFAPEGLLTEPRENRESVEDAGEEIARIKQAFQLFLVVLEYAEGFLAKKLSSSHSNIFAMEKVLLEETAFRNRIIDAIREDHLNAPRAVRRVIEEYKKRFAECSNEPVRDKMTDLDDLRIGLIDALDRPGIFVKNGGLVRKKKERIPHVAVTHDLTTRFVIEQNLQGTKGILAENGGKTSHAAILCRALGIPCVSSLKNLMALVEDGAPVVVNGDQGKAFISFSGERDVPDQGNRNEK